MFFFEIEKIENLLKEKRYEDLKKYLENHYQKKSSLKDLVDIKENGRYVNLEVFCKNKTEEKKCSKEYQVSLNQESEFGIELKMDEGSDLRPLLKALLYENLNLSRRNQFLKRSNESYNKKLVELSLEKEELIKEHEKELASVFNTVFEKISSDTKDSSGKLSMTYSKKDEDFLVKSPNQYDGHLIFGALAMKNYDKTKKDYKASLIDELKSRGYDLSTLKFSIKKIDISKK